MEKLPIDRSSRITDSNGSSQILSTMPRDVEAILSVVCGDKSTVMVDPRFEGQLNDHEYQLGSVPRSEIPGVLAIIRIRTQEVIGYTNDESLLRMKH